MMNQDDNKLKEMLQRYGGNLDQLFSSDKSHRQEAFQRRILVGITTRQPLGGGFHLSCINKLAKLGKIMRTG